MIKNGNGALDAVFSLQYEGHVLVPENTDNFIPLSGIRVSSMVNKIKEKIKKEEF